jgi:hypothetical protein
MRDVRLGDNYCNGSGRAFGAATLVNHFRNIMFFCFFVFVFCVNGVLILPLINYELSLALRSLKSIT